MRRHRTARGTFVSSLLAGSAAAALTAAAARGSEDAVPRLVFPLVAKPDLRDNYGDPRGNGRYAGIDMENLRWSACATTPGGRWLEIEPRTLELTVPPEATVAASIGGVTGAAVRAFRTPLPVAAYTVKAKTTADAIIGSAGALRLSRVARLP